MNTRKFFHAVNGGDLWDIDKTIKIDRSHVYVQICECCKQYYLLLKDSQFPDHVFFGAIELTSRSLGETSLSCSYKEGTFDIFSPTYDLFKAYDKEQLDEFIRQTNVSSLDLWIEYSRSSRMEELQKAVHSFPFHEYITSTEIADEEESSLNGMGTLFDD